MISVIIPTCDRPAEFLRDAIASVLGQTSPPAEVIVVDNGTGDADPGALPEGVTLYRLPPRVGPSRARNFGAAMASGESLAFLDDDDLWDCRFLQECLKALKEEKSECVYGSVLNLRDSCLSPKFSLSAGSFSLEQLLTKNPGTSGQNLLIRKETFWRLGGFDESLWNSEDRDLGIRLLLSGTRISFCPEAKAIVRIHADSRLSDRPSVKFRLLLKYGSRLALSTQIRIVAVLVDRLARRLALGIMRNAQMRVKLPGKTK